jgi:hypothetical protein
MHSRADRQRQARGLLEQDAGSYFNVLALTKAGRWSVQFARLSKGQQQQLYLAGSVLIARKQALLLMISTSGMLNAASSQLRWRGRQVGFQLSCITRCTSNINDANQPPQQRKMLFVRAGGRGGQEECTVPLKQARVWRTDRMRRLPSIAS